MGMLLSSYIFPHPPIIVPEIGKGEEFEAQKTINGCKQAALDIKEKNPDTIVIITPHGPVFKDAVSISVEKSLGGSFGNFRCPNVKFIFENDMDLVNNVLKFSEGRNIRIARLGPELSFRFNITNELDHGALVPLYYITKEVNDFKIVHISIGFLSYQELFEFGEVIEEAIEKIKRNVVVVASGDLSHRLIPGAPAGYSKRGKEFDELFVRLVGEGRFNEIMTLDQELIEEAGECGLRSFIIMFGCLKKYEFKPQVLSYEGPFGVGYCVAKFEITRRKNNE